VNACRDLGISAELTPGEVNLNLPGPRSQVPCFEAPAGGEVVVDGRKLIGSAMRAHGGSILQHGAILLDWDGVLQAGSMGLDDDVALRSQITTFAEQLGQAPARNELEQELVSAFVRTLEIRLEQGSLTEGESQREDALLERFQL
jgi:lipoate-protein ligase A